MTPRNVLVFPAGSEIGLEIYSALRDAKEVNVFAAGQAISNHAPFVCGKYHELPSIHEPNWVDELNRLIGALAIEFVIPAYDDVLLALAAEQHRISATIVTSPLETCRMARSKTRTYAALESVVPC